MNRRLRFSWNGFALAVLLAGVGSAGCRDSTADGAGEGAVPEGDGAALTDVTEAAGLAGYRHVTGAFGEKWFPETVGPGVALFDYDADGWLDLLAVRGANWPGRGEPVPALQLFRNEGGSFRDATSEAGLDSVVAYGMGLAAADYDNDGDRDFFFSTLGENLLFRNDGGRFTEVGRAAGVAGEPSWSTSAIFFDADRDGRADLYVGNYVEWTPETDIFCTMDGRTKSYCTPQAYTGVPGRFYRNNGDGTFTDRTEEAGFLPSPGKTLGVTELDFNQDGWPDLAVANDTERALLYENDGDGTFTEKGVLSGIAFDENGKARAGMGIDAGDVDNSGRPTLFVGHFTNEMMGVFRYEGNGLFSERAAASRIGFASLPTLTFGLFLFDANLDGLLDLFVANGHIAEEVERVHPGTGYRQPQQLYLNRGDGVFEDVSARAGGALGERLVARGAASGDVDRDGDQDVLLVENGGGLRLWRNDVQGRRFLRVRLEGRRSGRDALGARLVAVVDGRRLERRVRTGSSFLSQSETAVTFGLDRSARVDSLLVYWPAGGVDRFADLPADRHLRIVEGTGRFEPEPPPSPVAAGRSNP